MSKPQLRLPGIDPPQQLRPDPGRLAPAFWVHRLRILEELTSDSAKIIRDVTLRRGLNIVWAPPHSADAKNALFKDGVAGHTAGKSTFCRLLRHVLGDGGYAPDGVKRRIRAALPNAWVTAEVFVAETRWAVARPLGLGQRPFCVPGGAIEDLAEPTAERHDYQEFLQALADSTVPHLGAKSFPTTDKAVAWEHVLPWLVRDQDCRFADFLEWRHSASGSDAPALNVEERQFLVRTVLGLIADEERRELARNAELVGKREHATRMAPVLRHQADLDRERLAAVLGSAFSVSATPLFASAARAELDARRSALTRRQAELRDSDPRAGLQSTLLEAATREGAIRGAREQLEDVIGKLAPTVAELAGSEQSAKLGLPPPTGFCAVAMNEARDHGCPLAKDRPAELSAKRGDAAAGGELVALKKQLRTLETKRNALTGDLLSAARATTAARSALVKAGSSYAEAEGGLRDQLTRLDDLERLIVAAEVTTQSADSTASSVKDLGRQIEESYGLQEKARTKQRAGIGRFSARFDYVVRALIGDQVSGHVETSGRSLSLTVEERGERESAAISTIKLLAFDLAAVAASIEGRGAFPRFLVHDGPREADMSDDVYGRLFVFAEELERCFEGEAGFQYVVTTTTRPPEKFVAEGAGWLRLELSGLDAAERLFRRNL